MHLQYCLLLMFYAGKNAVKIKKLITEAYGTDAMLVQACVGMASKIRNRNFELTNKEYS